MLSITYAPAKGIKRFHLFFGRGEGFPNIIDAQRIQNRDVANAVLLFAVIKRESGGYAFGSRRFETLQPFQEVN